MSECDGQDELASLEERPILETDSALLWGPGPPLTSDQLLDEHLRKLAQSSD